MAGCGPKKKMAKGGMVKKVRGYAKGGSVNRMRSENTEAAKAEEAAIDASLDQYLAERKAQEDFYEAGREAMRSNSDYDRKAADARVSRALSTRARRIREEASDKAGAAREQTGYGSQRSTLPSQEADERLANSPMGIEDGRLKYAKGGLVKKSAKGKPVKMAKGGMMCSPRKKMAMGIKKSGK